MFEFKLLDTFYDVDITLVYPDYRHTYYHCREHLTARYDKDEESYFFHLEERENVLINNEYPTEIMDMLMTDMGNSIYPVYLHVSPKGEILKVKNFESLRQRWQQKTEELLEIHYTHHFFRYIEIASRNMKSEDKFRETLTRNSFVKLVLKPLDAESFLFSFKDFPSKGMVALFLCTRRGYDEESGIVRDYEAKLISSGQCEGDGYVRYAFSDLNDIEQIEARFNLKDREGQKSIKYISIKADKRERVVSRKKSFWERMFE